MNMATYTIPACRVPSFNSRLLKINRRAAKLGVEPLTVTGTTTRMEKVEGTPHYREVVDIEVSAAGNVQVAGWSFVAALTVTEGGTIIRVAPAYQSVALDLTAYYNAPHKCDHCRLERRRSGSFVLQHENGGLTQVGSTCLNSFVGSADFLATCQFDPAGELDEEAESYGSGGREALKVALVDYVAAVMLAVKSWGWAPSADDHSTARVVQHCMFTNRPHELNEQGIAVRQAVLAGEVDKTRAIEALDWLHEQPGSTVFMHNLKAACSSDYINDNFGLVAALVPCFDRELCKRAERAEREPSRHVGRVGERLTLDLTVLGATPTESQFGFGTFLRLTDDQGNLFVWSASKSIEVEAGDKVNLTATVKAHDEYKGVKQTRLTRCRQN
jgi:hypothetical protein